ncbi:MAG: helix-turn-helix transcriptional regulator [Alteraurantiacibacter sp.]
MTEDPSFDGRSRAITAKQRAVLDLLIQHKTSKEIARILGISHYTVDQRIAAARKKLGVTSRNELAAAYQVIAASGQNVSSRAAYQFPYVEFPTDEADQSARASKEPDLTAETSDANCQQTRKPDEKYLRVAPEIIEGPYGVYFRLAAIGILAIMMLVIALGGLAAFGQISDLMFS